MIGAPATPPTTAKHSALNRAHMLDWLRHCADEGTGAPTDEEIVDRFGFATTEQARTLLADLADRGEISIRGVGVERQISIGRPRRAAPASAPRPAPAIAKPDPAVDQCVAKIAQIVSRKPAATARAASASAALARPALAKPTTAPVTPPMTRVAEPTPAPLPTPAIDPAAQAEPNPVTTTAPVPAPIEEVPTMSNAQPVARTITAGDIAGDHASAGSPLLAVPKRSPAADATRALSDDLWSRREAMLDQIDALAFQAATLQETAIELEVLAYTLEQAA